MEKTLVIFMATSLFATATPAFAEHGNMKMEHEGVRECAFQAESIQQKIQRLETEIAKGEKKYDAEQLKKLEAKLKEANQILDQLSKP